MSLLRQIKYFQAVVRNNSFSEAAEQCHISQSAISQQIKALETELGFPLLERKNRKFVLTPAGEYFYKKSLVLIADYEQMCREATKIAHGDAAVLKSATCAVTTARKFFRRWRSFRQNTRTFPSSFCTETMKNYSLCSAPVAQIWCSMISGEPFPMNMST